MRHSCVALHDAWRGGGTSRTRIGATAGTWLCCMRGGGTAEQPRVVDRRGEKIVVIIVMPSSSSQSSTPSYVTIWAQGKMHPVLGETRYAYRIEIWGHLSDFAYAHSRIPDSELWGRWELVEVAWLYDVRDLDFVWNRFERGTNSIYIQAQFIIERFEDDSDNRWAPSEYL